MSSKTVEKQSKVSTANVIREKLNDLKDTVESQTRNINHLSPFLEPQDLERRNKNMVSEFIRNFKIYINLFNRSEQTKNLYTSLLTAITNNGLANTLSSMHPTEAEAHYNDLTAKLDEALNILANDNNETVDSEDLEMAQKVMQLNLGKNIQEVMFAVQARKCAEAFLKVHESNGHEGLSQVVLDTLALGDNPTPIQELQTDSRENVRDLVEADEKEEELDIEWSA